MEQEKYESKIVKIMDAQVKQEWGNENDPQMVQTLYMILQDVDTEFMYSVVLSEKDVCEIIGYKQALTSKQMIDLAQAFRQREDPIKLLVPIDKTEIFVDDVLKSKVVDAPKKRRPRRRRKKTKAPATS